MCTGSLGKTELGKKITWCPIFCTRLATETPLSSFSRVNESCPSDASELYEGRGQLIIVLWILTSFPSIYKFRLEFLIVNMFVFKFFFQYIVTLYGLSCYLMT